MPAHSGKPRTAQDIKVVIRAPDGNYLARNDKEWILVSERCRATVLQHLADHVPEQLESLRKTHGIVLEEEPVPLEEIYEMCDRCRELAVPFMMFFDGKNFLCPDCRSLSRKRRPNA